MPWIKRNLSFVIGLAVAFVLVGVGVWYLLAQKAGADQVAQELQDSATQLDTLIKRKPFPNDDNIKAAKVEQERLAVIKTNLLKEFQGPPPIQKLDTAQFKQLMETAIHELEQDAERYGVKIPSKYSFTFEDARKKLSLPDAKLPALAYQVIDIREICKPIFASKIHELVSLKRFSVLTEETGADYVPRKVSDNAVNGMSSHPYEVTIESFASELADVLAGFVNSNPMIVVKWINIERGQSGTSNDPNNSTSPNPMSSPYGMNPMLMARYGMMARYGRPGGMPGAPAEPAPAATPSPLGSRGAVVEEKLLRITLGVDVIRPTPPKPAGAASSGRGASAAPAADGAAADPAATPAAQ